MATQLSFPQSFISRTSSIEERIQGTTTTRIISEFVSTSALFPILDAIRAITADGWISYLSEPPHYIIFLAAFVQAWFLGTAKSDKWPILFFGNLLGFGLYAPLDMAIEGSEFFTQPYHWLFAGFSLLMACLSALQSVTSNNAMWQAVTTLLRNVGKVLLFPAIYMIAELALELSVQLNVSAWQDYMASKGHQFIFYGALFFGVLLGLAALQRDNYASYLRFLANQLKKYSEWSLSSDLIANAIDDPDVLQLRRVERTIMFMDIRGFTAWSEQVDPGHAVQMLNRFYNTAETVISQHQGHKPNFTADEIMTRFSTADAALNTALDLQRTLKPLLASFNLAVGIGIHTGEVIEGLMGSDTTRKYDIIGDAANTAKRLESAAGKAEIVISEATYQALSQQLTDISPRTLQVKGKAESLQAYAIHS